MKILPTSNFQPRSQNNKKQNTNFESSYKFENPEIMCKRLNHDNHLFSLHQLLKEKFGDTIGEILETTKPIYLDQDDAHPFFQTSGWSLDALIKQAEKLRDSANNITMKVFQNNFLPVVEKENETKILTDQAEQANTALQKAKDELYDLQRNAVNETLGITPLRQFEQLL